MPCAPQPAALPRSTITRCSTVVPSSPVPRVGVKEHRRVSWRVYDGCYHVLESRRFPANASGQQSSRQAGEPCVRQAAAGADLCTHICACTAHAPTGPVGAGLGGGQYWQVCTATVPVPPAIITFDTSTASPSTWRSSRFQKHTHKNSAQFRAGREGACPGGHGDSSARSIPLTVSLSLHPRTISPCCAPSVRSDLPPPLRNSMSSLTGTRMEKRGSAAVSWKGRGRRNGGASQKYSSSWNAF